MAFKLPKLDRTVKLVTDNFYPTSVFHQWWQEVVKRIEEAINGLEAALAAAVVAISAANDAQAAADAAQAAADAAQATADSIVVPPSGTRSVSTSGSINPDDYIIQADASGGAITLTLPLAITTAGPFIIKKTDSTANAVNLAVSLGDTINGGAGPVAMTLSYEQRNCSSDESGAWFAS